MSLDSDPTQVALGEKIADYYRNLSNDSPIPPDETRTHNFRRIVEAASRPGLPVDTESILYNGNLQSLEERIIVTSIICRQPGIGPEQVEAIKASFMAAGEIALANTTAASPLVA